MANNPFIQWFNNHPRLAAWIVLAVGMVGMLLYFGRDVGLTLFNWVSLIVATVGVAGLCIWIISWEDENEDAPDAAEVAAVSPTPDGEADVEKVA